jgi:hypothetical protein
VAIVQDAERFEIAVLELLDEGVVADHSHKRFVHLCSLVIGHQGKRLGFLLYQTHAPVLWLSLGGIVSFIQEK